MLKIVEYPNPILSLVAKKVDFPLSSSTKELIRSMWETVDGVGVGLAAPQVGHSLQLCIIGLDPDRVPKKQKIKNNFVMINPSIVFASEVQSNMIEGCRNTARGSEQRGGSVSSHRRSWVERRTE